MTISAFDPGFYGGFDEDRDRDRQERERQAELEQAAAASGLGPQSGIAGIGAPAGPSGAESPMGLSEFADLINAAGTRGQQEGQEQVAARREAEFARLESLGLNPTGLFPGFTPTPRPDRTGEVNAAGRQINQRLIPMLMRGQFGNFLGARNRAYADTVGTYPELWRGPEPSRVGEIGAMEREAGLLGPGGGARPPVEEPPAAPTPRPSGTSPITGLASLFGYGGGGGGWTPDHAGLPRGAIRGEDGQVYWSDSSRGNPQPDMAYSQALIPWTPDDYARYGMSASGGGPPGGGGTSIIDRLMSNYGEDIGYLRGEPFQTNEEQAMVERSKSRIRNNFDMERQRARDEAGAMNRPLAPMLEDINRREQLALADVDQGLLAATAGERRSRRAESRNVLGLLETLERARQAEAMGIESGLDEQERQRLMDLAALMGLAPNVGQVASISGNLLNYAGNLGAQARAAQQQQYQGLGDLAYLYALNRGQRGVPQVSGSFP